MAIMKTFILASLSYALAAAAPFLNERDGQGSGYIANYPGIQFNSGRLTITVFSDLHFGEPYSEAKDVKTTDVMNSVLDNEHSDLVVLNGDLISCESVGPNQFNSIIDRVVDPIARRNLPFAATFGNHDYSETCSPRSMASHMWWDIKGSNNQKLSFTTQSVDGQVEEVGWSNYYIPVYSSTDSNRLELLLWFFDSKGGRVYQPGSNLYTPMDSYVDDRVVSWFQNTRDEFNSQNGRIIPSLAFVHIPVQATRAFQKSGQRGEKTQPGLNAEMIGHEDDCDGIDCYNHRDYASMKALVETEGLIYVFSGHDHGVDWCMKWAKDLATSPSYGNGVSSCFNRHSGFGGYSNWERGARIIEIQEDTLWKKEVETWIRLEAGGVSGHVTLNATYGIDQYPEIEPEESSGWWEQLEPVA